MSQEITTGEPRDSKEPLISTHGNITLIGVEHFANPAEQQFTTTDLEALLGESDDLYFESGNVDNIDLDAPPRSYEQAALQFFIRDGKKTIIVGVRHAENIGPMLNGQDMPRPFDWQTTTYGFDRDEKKQVETFGKIANGKQKASHSLRERMSPPWKKN